MDLNLLKENSNLIFTILGLIVFVLSTFLGITVVKLRDQKRKQADYNTRLAEEVKKQDFYFKDSIITICKATVQGQCEFSEACIRIKKLLEYYPEIASEEQFKVIQNMYEEIKGFSTHGERLNLSKQEIFNQDKARFSIEAKYKQDMHKSLEILQKKIESII